MTTLTGQIAIIVASVALLLGVMRLVRIASTHYSLSAELQRKAVHVATGLYALMLPILFSETWPVLILVGVTLVVMLILRLPRLARTGVGAAVHGVERKSYGDMLLALAVGFLFVRSHTEPVLYVLPILILTLSDAAAALVGTTYGRRRFTVESGTKSIEGVAAFFLVTCIISMTTLLLMTDIPRLNVVLLAFAVAFFGALVEADSWRGLDNLFLPIGVHLFLAEYMIRSPLAIIGVIAILVIALAAMRWFANPLGLTAHAARAYTIALFLICSYTEVQNAILPGFAIVAHIAARAAAPSQSPYPDLDSIAALAAVSLLWMFFGEWFGKTAINFYTMTFAGVIATLTLVTFAKRLSRPKLLLATIGVCLALAVSFQLVVGLGPAEARWHGELEVPLVLTLMLASAVAILAPDVLLRYRSPRVAAVAGLVPAVTYLLLASR